MMINVKEAVNLCGDITEKLQGILDGFKENGGELYFPSGEYTFGSLRLWSDTSIILGAGARILASTDFDKYPRVFEDEVKGFIRGTRRGIFYAEGSENITIKGEGVIEGNGSAWWEKEGDYTRPRTISFINCKNILIEGIKIYNSPCWTIHPICSENISIKGVMIKNPYDSPNTDGINPESCKNVRISDCLVDVGDDCITLKSGWENDTLQKQFPCENITVTGCTFVHGHGGVVMGSEMSGGVKNVTVSNCVFQNTERGIRIKTRRRRGGFVEDIIVNNVIMDNVIAGITINGFYMHGEQNAPYNELFTREKMPLRDDTPTIKNILISDVIIKEAQASGIYFLGIPECPIENVNIKNIVVDTKGCEGEFSVCAENIKPSKGEGIYLNNVKNVKISDCTISAATEETIIENRENTFLNGKLI